jgi:hypothetical protein
MDRYHFPVKLRPTPPDFEVVKVTYVLKADLADRIGTELRGKRRSREALRSALMYGWLGRLDRRKTEAR